MNVTRDLVLALVVILGIYFAAFAVWHPRGALHVWLFVVAMVPEWIGVDATIYLPPATLVGVLLLASCARAKLRVEPGDWLVVGFVALGTTLVVTGVGTHATWGAMIAQWGLAYLIGRAMAQRVGPAQVGIMFAGWMVAVAALAVVEYVRDWHPFARLSGPNTGQDAWAPILLRGDRPRSEWAFGHPIALGGALVLAIPFVLLVKEARWRLVLLAVLLAGTAVTLSRGPAVGAGATVLLCVWALPRRNTLLRIALLAGGVVTVWLLLPTIVQIGSSDSNISISSQYRANVFAHIFTDVRPFTRAHGVVEVNGVLIYRGFTSVDDALLELAIDFGWVLAALLLVGLLVAAWRVLRRHMTPADVALVGQIPVLATVAFITQYAMLVWFVAGIAVTWASVQHLNDHESRGAGAPVAALAGPGSPAAAASSTGP